MKKCMLLLAALFLLTGCAAPAKTPTEPAATPAATTLPAEPSSAPTEPAPAEISVMDLVGTWEQVWAEVEGDRNEVDPSRYLLQITGEKENELFASYVCVDYSENGYTDRPLIRDDREMYPGCGNDSWVMDVDYISPFEATQAITLLENGDLLMQNSFFYDGTIPVVSYACFTRSTRELSVARVRQQLMSTGEYFAVAYLGYLDAEPQGGLMDWIKAENPQLLEIYPFIADIPQERIIGTMGEVYCIIPRWDNTTVAVDLLTDSVPGKVLYRSEVGSPIVLMCNGSAFAPDTQVVITDEDATTLWYPGLDENGSVALPYEDDWFKARDISLYESAPYDPYQQWLDSGYLAPTAEGLKDTSWTAPGLYNGRATWLFLALNSNGTAKLEWAYQDEAATQGSYTGTWQIRGTLLELDLQDENGNPICDTYRPLISMSGEDLALGGGADPCRLPLDTGEDAVFALFTLSMG